MKKIYQNPTTKIVKIKTVQMIAASPTQTMTIGDTVEDASVAESRRGRSVWDNDDYDEEGDYDE